MGIRLPGRASGPVRVICVAAAGWLGGCGAPEPRHEQRHGRVYGRNPVTFTIPPALIRQSRPIGSAPQFHQAATGPFPGRCRAAPGADGPGRYPVHVEVFLDGLVAVVPRGIGVRGPVQLSGGRIVAARCFGEVVSLEPTGVVLVRRRAHGGATLRDILRAWGAKLPTGLRIYVAGAREASARALMETLRPREEIVLEGGPFVPPHHSYNFPP